MKSHLVQVCSLSLAALLFLMGCAASQTASPLSTDRPVSKATVAKAQWEQRWETLVAKAKAEGKLMVYTTAGSDVRSALQQAFGNKYGIEIESVVGRGAEMGQKVQTECRAGLYLADVYMGGPTDQLTVLKPAAGILIKMEPLLVLPEVTRRDVWVGGNLPLSKEGLTMRACRSPRARPLGHLQVFAFLAALSM